MFFGVITDAENIVGGYVVEYRKFYQNVGWNISLTKLIVTVYLLRAVECFCQILLCEIAILSQISDSSVYHNNSVSKFLKKLYQTAKCSIDIYRKLRYNEN